MTQRNSVLTMSKVEYGSCGVVVATDSKKSTNNEEVDDSNWSLEEYKMNHMPRGLAIIFNQENFKDSPKKSRRGTNTDCKNLAERFKALNFVVQCHQDLRKVDVLAKLREAAEADHRDVDCFCCVFLSHGEKDKVFAYDGQISIDDVTALFKGDKCRSLVGKPKIFILQACRGREYDLPVTGMVAGEEEDQVVADAGVVPTLPAGADFLMCYSVAKGYYSMRDPIKGSWYIQDLCETLKKYGDSLEFTELLTLVNRKVSKRSIEESSNPNARGKKQIPCFASMLTKKLYFRPER